MRVILLKLDVIYQVGGKKSESDGDRQVGQKWPQKIGYHLWMAPYPIASAGGLGPQVGFDGACELRSQKDIVRFQKFFLP